MDSEIQNNQFSIIKSLLRNKLFIAQLIGLFILLLIICNTVVWSPPSKFPLGFVYEIKSGESYTSVAYDLRDANVIKSPYWFKGFIYIFSLGTRKVIAGDYLMYQKQSVWALAWRVSHGDFHIKPMKITIPEGLNSFEIADIFSKNFPNFNRTNFLNLVQKENLEGYLFPDTYFFMPNVKEEEIISLMNGTFNEKIKSIEADIKSFGKPLKDVIKMASILEEEARLYETRQIVAGILWKRLSLGMALQIDSSFKYINGKTTKDLTLEDLKIKSPYNLYIHRGLPPTPISNPGLDAIRSAINPIKTKYFYFLTDNNGNMHYAVTLEEHAANKFKYLK